VADQGDRPAGGDLEVDALEHRAAGCVLERDPLEADEPGSGRQRRGVRRVRDLLGLVHDLEDPLARRGCALRLSDPHAEHAQRHDEHQRQHVEEEEVAVGERPGGDHAPADEQDGGLRDDRQEREQRDVDRPLTVRSHALLEHALGAVLELGRFGLLLGKRLDDVDADDVLLGYRRDVGEALLHVAQHGMGDVAVAVGDDDDQRRHGSGGQRELPVHDEHHAGDDHDRQHVLEEEDEPVAEEEADGLQVDGRAGHQLARLVAVVEAEREPDELGVQGVAHVELDPERLAARDHPPAEHEGGAGEADREHGRHQLPELLLVVRGQRVLEGGAGEVRDRDRGQLRADREEHRHHQRPPVRAQESEQARERPAVWDSHLPRVPAPSCCTGSRRGD
jgi:hypothetical protein